MSKTSRVYWLINKDPYNRRGTYGPFSRKRAYKMLDLLIGEYFVVKEV